MNSKENGKQWGKACQFIMPLRKSKPKINTQIKMRGWERRGHKGKGREGICPRERTMCPDHANSSMQEPQVSECVVSLCYQTKVALSWLWHLPFNTLQRKEGSLADEQLGDPFNPSSVVRSISWSPIKHAGSSCSIPLSKMQPDLYQENGRTVQSALMLLYYTMVALACHAEVLFTAAFLNLVLITSPSVLVGVAIY